MMKLLGLRELSTPARWFVGLLTFLLLLIALAPLSRAQALDKPTLVVTLAKLDGDPIYARKVLVATPRPDGAHVGFILNRPTSVTMASTFPDHAPSRAVTEPVYFGGPVLAQAIIALVRSDASPIEGAVAVGPGVWALVKANLIDEFMERDPNAARYFAGYVRWKPGELAEEVRSGMVMLAPFDADKILAPDTSKMYEELVTPDRKPKLET